MLTPERWRLIEHIFHGALHQPPAGRQAFITSSCAGDEEVRREVESLLAADSPYDSGAALLKDVIADWAASTAPETITGREIGGYRVVSLLGEGGMGEVYLADDLSLGRRVALKLLPVPFTRDMARLRRFTEEARAASALNHPNIITVHQVGEFDGRPYIVTEFIDGETLRSRIERGPIPETEAVEIALQAARALRAAHDDGIVHRDIKPENLMIRRDGYVKVLDFGLAKLAPDEQMDGAMSRPAAGAARTRVGAVLGTPRYMAPEQALGAAVDERADIYSLSVVLYEMVTGTLPEVTPDGPVDGGSVAAPISPGLARVLRCGLAADPAARYQRIHELIDNLEALGAAVGARERRTARLRRARLPLAIAALAAAIAIPGWRAYQRVFRGPLVSSLAVLPLANAGGDPDLDYLGDGIADGVIYKLSQLPHLRVIARSTAFQFEGRENQPVKVGRELHVDAVLTGRVVPHGDTADVELQLVDVPRASTLWRGHFTVRLAAVAALEQRIAERVTARLRLPSVAPEPPMDARAHTLYLKARYQLNKRTPEGLRLAQALFDRALARDPDNAMLRAGQAEAWALLGAYSILPPSDTFPRAIAAARQALDQNANMAEARTTLALCLFLYERNWPAAEADFRRVTQARPGYALAHHWYGEFLMARGRTDEALAQLKRAQELDPLSLVIPVDEGRADFFGHRFRQARQSCQGALEVSPTFVPAIDCLAMVAVQQGRYDDAIRRYAEVSRLWGSDSGLPGQALALAAAGRRVDAEKILARLSRPGRPAYPQPLLLAFVDAALGRKNEAFRWLEVARQQHANNIAYLKADPRVDSLRHDPRWTAFAREVGLN